MKVTTYDGQEIELDGKGYQDYKSWEKAFVEQVGKDLASKFPDLYGNIQFNIQGGKLVNWNITSSGIPDKENK